jgi:hypothetical protein
VKTQRLIASLFFVAACLSVFALFNSRPSPRPCLLVRAYEGSTSNAVQVAKLELHNTTSKDIWLYYSGEEFPLRPPFIERRLSVLPTAANASETNVFSVRIGHFFMHGEKLVPGDSVVLDFPLHDGEPAKLVGVSYYLGTFADGNDFIGNLGTPLLDDRANLKQRAEFYFQKFRRSFRAPKQGEVWCSTALSFRSVEGPKNN